MPLPASRAQHVIVRLQPDELGFQVAYLLLKAAHLGEHAGIWPADVAA